MRLNSDITKEKVVYLRNLGKSIREIGIELDIAKSTIGDFINKSTYSGWWDNFNMKFDIKRGECYVDCDGNSHTSWYDCILACREQRLREWASDVSLCRDGVMVEEQILNNVSTLLKILDLNNYK